RVTGHGLDHVMIDNVAAARLATGHLIGLGRRRIAAIGDQPEETRQTARLRTQGYREALSANNIPLDERLVRPTAYFHRADGAAAMAALLALPEPPDAVFCYNDLLALGALREMLRRGVRVPEDVALVGFDDIEDGRYATPSLSTISPDKAQIARYAVDLLLRRLDGDDSPAVEISADYQLMVRESTAGRR
ncbi:MAG TPA: substrate-binding domain-containing protein, partial [Rugosimonospora sp.]|nr:substrate-binding domain-containing protein [Rugosimonospora sp.]